jgi:hypothetical protein
MLASRGQVFDGSLELPVDPGRDWVVQLSPIKKGWSVIGRSDKFLSAAAVTKLDIQADHVSLTLHESGPFAIYSADGAPKSDTAEFKSLGNGLYIADLPVGKENAAVTITR